MKRAIAMRCTKEQWESIKHNFKKEEILDEDFSLLYPYLVNDFGSNNRYGIGFWYVEDDQETHEVFNADIFLEACGIETESFKITKDTILKYQMKDEFPELFEEKLVVGKWYISSVWLINYQENNKCYGFCLINDTWDEGLGHRVESHKLFNYREATKEEVETALIGEWEKRLSNAGSRFINPLDNEVIVEIGRSNLFLFEKNILYGTNGDKCVYFNNGKWAEIIETITKTEAEKLLNKKIV